MKLVWKSATPLRDRLIQQLWDDWNQLDQGLTEHWHKCGHSLVAAEGHSATPTHYSPTKMTKQMNRNQFLKTSLGVGAATVVAPFVAKANATADSPPQLAAKVIRAPEGKKINVLGDHMLVKLTGEDTYGQFTLIEETNDPGVAIPPHVHSREDEVFKVLEGQLELTVGDTTTILKAGDIGFGPRGVPHSWKTVGTEKTRVILSVFPSGIELMFEELASLPAGPPDMAKVMEICGRQGIKFV